MSTLFVERIDQHLNKGIKICTQERGTPAMSRDAILLVIYGWNSCPVPMTDITRSMLVCVREFSLSIDFSHKTLICLTGNKKWTETYAANQARLLLHSCEITSLLLNETCSHHQTKTNELKPGPLGCKVGSIVLETCAVKSDKANNKVDIA